MSRLSNDTNDSTNNATNQTSETTGDCADNQTGDVAGVSHSGKTRSADGEGRQYRHNGLTPLTPEAGVESFLELKRSEVDSVNTLDKYEQRLMYLLQFLDTKEINNLNKVGPRLIRGFRHYRRTEGNNKDGKLGQKTMRDDIYLIRDFVEHGEEINAIEEGVSDSIRIPELSGGDGICDEFLKPERAEEIREYLRKYNYASRDHAVWVIWLETGRRISCLRSLDIEDFGYNEDHGSYLHFRHRPETELKNDKQSEEKIYVGESAAEVIEDYCSESRIDVLNENGREPLLTTNRGRISSTTLRKTAYNYTRTCVVGSECPHGRDPEDCAAKQNIDKASKCPSSRSPHAVRSGFATTCRRRGITPVELSNRFDASPEVIKKHYEKTTTDERAKARKPRFDKVRDDGGGFL